MTTIELIMETIAIIMIAPMLGNVFLMAIAFASTHLDLVDIRLSAIGVTQHLTDCAVVEGCEREDVKALLIRVMTLEQDILRESSK